MFSKICDHTCEIETDFDSGHYDSRATEANDYTSDAPGADDEYVASIAEDSYSN